MDLISIIPAAPTSETPVTIAAVWSGCIIDSGIQRSGDTFRIHFNYHSICFGVPPGATMYFAVGVLRPGPYSIVEEVLVEGESQGTFATSFEVAAAPGNVLPAPTLDLAAMVFLAVGLVLASASFFRLTIRSTRP